jgi:rSAM/selenodomain-associated transferase 1
MSDHFILMTRYPQIGRSKTRFIPALGAEGAARLHRKLVEHSLAEARLWRQRGENRHITVACEGASVTEYREWLGEDVTFADQTGGSPGARMAVASVRAFTHGADRVVLSCARCPDLDAVQIARAFFGLDHADCVIGPSRAGGYYLIGLVTPTPALFAGIPWGTGAVLARTMATAHQRDLRVGVLPTLPTINGPGDLINAAALLEVHPLADTVG